MPSLIDIASAIGGSHQQNPQKSEVALVELDEKTDLPTDLPILKFQYFPATVQDSYATNYVAHQIPGGSLPIYQWVSGGPRTIAFEAVFTCDVDLLANGADNGAFLIDRLKKLGQKDRNVDIRSAILWLRRFMMPRYSTGEVGPVSALTYAPRKCQLIMPNSGIGVSGGVHDRAGVIVKDSIVCHMATCEVSYEMFHPSGLPKIAKVQLSFNQLAQANGDIRFPSASDDLDQLVNPNMSFPVTLEGYFGYPVVATGVNRDELPVLGNGTGASTNNVIGGAANVGFQPDISVDEPIIPSRGGRRLPIPI